VTTSNPMMICEEILVSDRDRQSREAAMPYPN
jgi:hypothetical protein